MKRITGVLMAGGLLLAALPASGQSAIVPGEIIRGSLSESDPRVRGNFFDCYAFDTQAGQVVSVTLVSNDFDAYLSLHAGGECGEELGSNDDGFEDGTDAFIEVEVGGGRYSVRASSLSDGETGLYGLSIEIH